MNFATLELVLITTHFILLNIDEWLAKIGSAILYSIRYSNIIYYYSCLIKFVSSIIVLGIVSKKR